MGRTLHFDIKKTNGRNFTDKEILKMIEISDKYNSGEFENAWTCENFYVNPLDYYPNWSVYGERMSSEQAWNDINGRYTILENKGLNVVEIIRQLKKDNVIRFYDDSANSNHGFTKTQGNEFNSLLVLTALIEMSKELPVEIELRDEGRFLMCDIKLKGGKVQPLLYDKIEDINGCCKGLARDIINEHFADELKGFPSALLKDILGWDRGKESSLEGIGDVITDLKDIYQAVKDVLEYEPFVYNIEQDWYDNPFIFSRKVDPADYASYECSITTLMGGFYGEAFGLTDKDPEEESYKMTGKLFGKLEEAGFNKSQVEILPKI